jgi:hypothetical protein
MGAHAIRGWVATNGQGNNEALHVFALPSI